MPTIEKIEKYLADRLNLDDGLPYSGNLKAAAYILDAMWRRGYTVNLTLSEYSASVAFLDSKRGYGGCTSLAPINAPEGICEAAYMALRMEENRK